MGASADAPTCPLFLSVPFEPNNPPCSFSNTCHLPSPQVYFGSLAIAGMPSPRYWGYPWQKIHPWKFKWHGVFYLKLLIDNIYSINLDHIFTVCSSLLYVLAIHWGNKANQRFKPTELMLSEETPIMSKQAKHNASKLHKLFRKKWNIKGKITSSGTFNVCRMPLVRERVR